MTKAQKFQRLHELVLDRMIQDLESGEMRAMDLQTCITFLNNNKVVEEKPPELSENEIIDSLPDEVEDAKI